MSSVTGGEDVATNHISLFPRGQVGTARRLYLSDSDNFKIPTDGFLSRWEFYVQSPGSAALQVWRPRPDLGDDRYLWCDVCVDSVSVLIVIVDGAIASHVSSLRCVFRLDCCVCCLLLDCFVCCGLGRGFGGVTL